MVMMRGWGVLSLVNFQVGCFLFVGRGGGGVVVSARLIFRVEGHFLTTRNFARFSDLTLACVAWPYGILGREGGWRT